MRGAALAADQVIVTSTPVDTGRLRGNWNTSVTVPNVTEDQTFKGSPEQAAARALQSANAVISSWTPNLGSIFISNGVPYAQKINDGGSDQAPAGMTPLGVQAALVFLRGQKVLRDIR